MAIPTAEVKDWFQFGILTLFSLSMVGLWAATLWILNRNTNGIKSLEQTVRKLWEWMHKTELENERRFGRIEGKMQLRREDDE